MGKLSVDMFLTLDGVYQAPGAPDEDREDGFSYGGWQQPLSDEEGGATIMDSIAKTDAILLGRSTYDIFVDYWPKQSDDNPVAKKFNAIPKYVVSRSLKKATWKGTTIVKGDLATEIPKIKSKHKDVHTWGSGDVVRQLLDLKQVDRLNLWVYPVVLGAGKRLFERGVPARTFRLATAKPMPKGALHLVYEPAGQHPFAANEPPAR